jgi:prevent-host-death family protein
MRTAWALQDAKNRFSEVVEEALHKGPQWITRRGQDAVVVVSAPEYRKLKKTKGSLVEFFRESPLFGQELDLRRPKESARKVDL